MPYTPKPQQGYRLDASHGYQCSAPLAGHKRFCLEPASIGVRAAIAPLPSPHARQHPHDSAYDKGATAMTTVFLIAILAAGVVTLKVLVGLAIGAARPSCPWCRLGALDARRIDPDELCARHENEWRFGG